MRRGVYESKLELRKREPMIFATKLRQIREIRKLSQAGLAAKAKMPPSAIAHFEGGRREPSLANFIKLYRALRVSPGVLLGEGGESVYDTLEMDEIEFIDLVRAAVIKRHKDRIKAIVERDRR